jgi:hypothetical protein
MPPDADPKVIAFTHAFCLANLAVYGYKRLVLLGSRSWGGIPTANSDHDFIAIVDSAETTDICTGGTLHTALFNALDQARRNAGLGAIDLMVMREAHYIGSSSTPGTFAYAASKNGYQFWP